MSDVHPRGTNIAFVVGCPRSGTTYLKNLLAYHPKIRSGPESWLFAWFLGPMAKSWNRPIGQTGFGGLRAYLTNDQFREVLYETSDKLLGFMAPNLKEDEIFVEKTPSHVFWIPEILEVFPNAKFIHLLRDARDVTASMLAASKSFAKNWAPKYAFVAAHRWVTHVNYAREAQKKLSPDQFFELRYENLRLNPMKELSSLMVFLNLDWSEKDLLEAIEKNDPKSKSAQVIDIKGEAARIQGPTVNRREGAIRKAKPGSWKQDLRFYDKWQVWLVARAKMKELGYPWRYPW